LVFTGSLHRITSRISGKGDVTRVEVDPEMSLAKAGPSHSAGWGGLFPYLLNGDPGVAEAELALGILRL
jgi:hypothetical protein